MKQEQLEELKKLYQEKMDAANAKLSSLQGYVVHYTQLFNEAYEIFKEYEGKMKDMEPSDD